MKKNNDYEKIKKIIENIIKEIVQDDLKPEERGGGENHSGDDTSGMYSKEKSPNDYFKDGESFPYLWHLKDDELKSKGKTDSSDSAEIGSQSTKSISDQSTIDNVPDVKIDSIKTDFPAK